MLQFLGLGSSPLSWLSLEIDRDTKLQKISYTEYDRTVKEFYFYLSNINKDHSKFLQFGSKTKYDSQNLNPFSQYSSEEFISPMTGEKVRISNDMPISRTVGSLSTPFGGFELTAQVSNKTISFTDRNRQVWFVKGCPQYMKEMGSQELKRVDGSTQVSFEEMKFQWVKNPSKKTPPKLDSEFLCMDSHIDQFIHQVSKRRQKEKLMIRPYKKLPFSSM